MSLLGSPSSFTYTGIAGLSVVSILGFLKLLKRVCKQRQEYAKREAELHALRRSLSASQLDVRTKEEALAAIKEEMEIMVHRLEEKDKKLDSAQHQNQTLRDQLKIQIRDLQQRKEELALLSQKHAETSQLLEARTLELKGAEVFLTKADAYSVADVLSLLNTLNSETFQIAAMVAEAFEFRIMENNTEDDAAVSEEVYASATDSLGARMVKLLRSSDHRQDPMIIQIALQAALSAYSTWIITSWDVEDADDERGLARIYAQIRSAEEQAVSGRWRALTRAHLPRMPDHELSMYLIDAFVNLLLAANVTQKQAELQSAIEARFGDRLGVIVKSAQKLRKAIGEEVTSCDLDILYVGHDSSFRPAHMDDAYASDSGKGSDEPEPVLCTTDLGLVHVVKKDGAWDETVLLRPKIVLKSGIDEMMAPEKDAA